MEAILNAKNIAWLSTLLCTYLAAKCATTFLRSHPRLFTAMALLALVWALLLPYYSDDITSELLPAYGGFILVYIGGLLALEAKARLQGSIHLYVTRYQVWGLWLFSLIAVPSALAIKGPRGTNITFLNPHEAEIVIGTLLNVLGYWSVAFGCRTLFGKNFFVVIGGVFIFYSIAEFSFTYWYFTNPKQDMPNEFRYLFSALKIIATAILSYRVSKETFSSEEQKKPFSTFSAKLLPFT